jgi:biotin synthase
MEAAGAIETAGQRALAGERLGREALLAAAEAARGAPEELLCWAGRLRRRVFGRQVGLCAIVPGKLGGCAEDCRWCAQSARAATAFAAPRRTPAEQIHQAAGRAARQGASRIGIVNSGRRPSSADLEEVVSAAGRVAADRGVGIRLCASLGALTAGQARRLADAGIARYHHNLETSSRFFGEVVSTHGYAERLATLAAAKAAGLDVCCGGLFGLGETWADRVDLALTVRDRVAPKSVPLNFLVPVAGTPLGERPMMPPIEALTVVALFRLAMPAADIKVAGGREAVLRDLQSSIFSAGATSCMIGDYLTTAGRAAEQDLRMLEDLGLRIVNDLRPAREWAAAATSGPEPKASPDAATKTG